MKWLPHRLVVALAVCIVATVGSTASAQQQGQPGRFDFYLMNVAWGPGFCSIQGTSPGCKPPRGFVLHGLWAQNDDGSYPVFCSHEGGPSNPAANLDLTPDLDLLHHEWDKHGTCANVGPQRFFAMERQAFHQLKVPARLERTQREISLTPASILDAFYAVNPKFPRGSILLSCAREQLTAVEACFSKDLQPIACEGLRSCSATTVTIAPGGALGR